MRLRKLIVTLGVGVALLASCAAPSVAPAPTPSLSTIPAPSPIPVPTPTPAPTPTETPTPESETVVKILGPEEIVFDSTISRCGGEDIPDLPARAFRDADGKVQLISTHLFFKEGNPTYTTGRRMVGDTLDSIKHDCNIIINSDKDPDPSKFNDREWLASTYTLDGKTIYALVHMGYWGTLHPGQCPSGDQEKCVNTSITLAISTDKGRTYSHATPPGHLVATQPYSYEPDAGPSEISCPSNIIYNPKDGYYYVMFYMVRKDRRDSGTGIMRTKTLDDPKSWCAWDGSDFTVQFIDPYQNPDADPAEHTPQPVSRQEILYMSSSLTFNTYFNKFILVGIVATGYTMEDRGAPGIYYSLSDDLIHWTPRRLIMAVQFPPSVVQPAGGNPEDAPCLTYVSLIDAEDTSRNFEITGQRPYLYCVRVNPTSPSPRERQLVRIPIEFAPPSPTPTAPPPPAAAPPSPTPAPTPTPEPTPTLATIPEETLASHFGICGERDALDEISKLGIRWNRCPLPFAWGLLEPESGEYDWRRADGIVQRHQAYNLGILAIIWPFAEWDQANWGPSPTGTGPIIDEEFLGRSRRKPYDMDAYRRFVSALVERYDGDGIDDMPGLKYPVKHWESGNEPSLQTGFWTFFNGSSEDYLEVLKATYEAVKEANPGAKVSYGGMAGAEPPMVPVFSFWEPIFEKGSQYFDIANIHAVGTRADVIVPELREFLSKYGIDKPIWVTEAEYYVNRYASLEEHGQAFVKSYVTTFACGVDKFFYSCFRPVRTGEADLGDANLIDESGERRPAYYGLETLIEKLAEGWYKFMVEGKPVYVLWGSGEIPEEITGEVLVTDIYGEETRTDSSAIRLTESPIFVESTHVRTEPPS